MYKKTYAYVEFQSVQDASAALAKWRQRGPRRLGNRPAELELSSMSNLMGDLYYRAKGIDWYGMDPVIKPDDANEPWNAFKGFFQPEHLTAILKQIETPNRVSPLATFCPQVTFSLALFCADRVFPAWRHQGVATAPLRVHD